MAQMEQIVASTTPVWKKTLSDAFFLGHPTLEYAKTKNRVAHQGGRKIIEPIIQNRTNGQFYKGITAMTPADNNEVGAAEYDWVFSEEYALIAGDELWMNSSDEGKVKLWDSKVKIAGASLATRWGEAFFADGTAFAGADTRLVPTPFEALADAGNTYTIGGLTSDDVSLWQGNNTSLGGALSLDAMEGMYVDCSEGTYEPDLIALSKAGFKKFWGLVQTNQRFLEKNAAVGFKNFMFNNATVYFDSNILTTGGAYTGQRAFFINTEHARLTVAEGMEFVTEEKEVEAHAYCQVIRFAGNFTTDGRRYQGVLHNFTV